MFVDGENYLFFPDGALVRYEPGISDRDLIDNNQSNEGGVSPLATEYDAVSPPAIIAAAFDPNEATHTIRLAISDTGDVARDSGLFIATLATNGDDTGNDTLLGGAGNDELDGDDRFDAADFDSAGSSVSASLAVGAATLASGVDIADRNDLCCQADRPTQRGNQISYGMPRELRQAHSRGLMGRAEMRR